ncbi:MAG: GAF domain-containing protein, partial [Mesorhizobium sp.]
MRDMAGGPRVLLKRLRELMQEPLEPQERLDRIVRDIASNMVAEVCSLYVLRADSVLELYATEGLNPKAVHLAQLRLGQGLVGTIAASARPLNLSNAQEHPAFQYLPETGEEIYHSFLGVPVLRAGRTLGVLVVQNKTMRQYAFGGEHREVLEAYRMFANDRGWVRRLEEAIRNGLTAEAAVEKVQSDMRARMLHMTDPYLRERMSDFDDLAN